MKVAAYIRVSTDEQAQEGYSIPAQRNRIEAFAMSQGWEIIQYYVDEGQSAKDLNRTELQRMLEGVKKGYFDVVLVYRLDRLTRSVLDLYQLLGTFDTYNCKFKSVTEIYDTTTAMGRLFLTLVAALAQWERENLGERVRMGMMQKVREGKWTMSVAPFGYDADGDNLVINHQEALIIKDIFSQYLQGKGMLSIARELNERGLPTRRGNEWQQGTISYILSNPIYMGNLRYNFRTNTENYFEVENTTPPLITEEEFQQVQRIIEQRTHSHPREATSPYIFSKVLKCARCGKKLIGKKASTKRGDKKYYSKNYICRSTGVSACDLPSINENILEEKFIEMLSSWNVASEANQLTKDAKNEKTADNTVSIQKLEQELKEIETRRNKWQYAWVKEMINDVDFQQRMKEETEKEKMIQKELVKLNPIESPSPTIDYIQIWETLKHNWHEMSVESKKQFIQLSLKYMVVDRKKWHKGKDALNILEVKFN